MKKAVIYARHSRVFGADKLLEKQIEYCTYYANKNGYEVMKIYSDLGLTTEPRPGYNELLSDAIASDWEYVIVAAFNRLTVTLEQFSNELAPLRDNDLRIVDIKERCIINLKEAKAFLDSNPVFNMGGKKKGD